MSQDVVTIWTITHRPSDLPGVEYAARAHMIGPRAQHGISQAVLTAGTLEEIRAKLPPGLHNLGRDLADEPGIVESWI